MKRGGRSIFKELKAISWADVRSGFVPVVVGYAIVAILASLQPLSLPRPEQNLPPIAGLGVVVLFTFTHGVIPVFFYRIFIFAPQESFKAVPEALKGHAAGYLAARGFLGIFAAFGYLHMALWYGIPMVALASFTSWVPLAAAVVHVAVAGKGRRAWAYIENGSTSLSLLLFLMIVGPLSESWIWAAVTLICQGLLMAVVECFGRPLWVKESIPVA